MFAIVDIQTGARLGDRFTSLPRDIFLPDGGVARFDALGQIEPGHAPRYALVETIEVSECPAYPCLVTAETRQFANGRDEILRVYAPNRAAYEREIESLIERCARAKGYVSADRLAGYGLDPVYSSEAVAFITWRSSVWVYVFAEIAKVQNGERPVPTLAELFAELPAPPWSVE
jgi:hypothetical protein